MRDRRWDFLYDRQKQPVKAYVVERFAEELAADVEAWPPPFVDWVSDELRVRWGAGARERPGEAALRLALEAARLDLAREFDAAERLIEADGERLTGDERAAVRLLVRFLTEKCLALKEWAEGARLTREDLADALRIAERRLFLVTR